MGEAKIGNILIGVLAMVAASISHGGLEGGALHQLLEGWDATKARTIEEKPKPRMSSATRAQKLKRGKNSDGRDHGRWGHLPHDCVCDACVRARQTQKANTRNKSPRDIEGGDKGYVIGIDLFGPFDDDVDGNE